MRGFENVTRVVELYQNLSWPLEGFILENEFLGRNSLQVTGIDGDTLKMLNQKNLTLIFTMKAGVPVNSVYGSFC